MQLTMDYYFFSMDPDIKGPIPRKGKTARQSYVFSKSPEEALVMWKEKNAWTGTAEGYMYRCRQENMHDAALGTSINNAYRSEAPLVIVERNAVKG